MAGETTVDAMEWTLNQEMGIMLRSPLPVLSVVGSERAVGGNPLLARFKYSFVSSFTKMIRTNVLMIAQSLCVVKTLF
jgi:hypothetical protein